MEAFKVWNEKNVWNQPGLLGLPGLIFFVDRYGLDAVEWSPETIQKELVDDFGVLALDNFNRLMAAISILTSDAFYSDLPTFIDLCNVLAGSGVYNPLVFDPADVYEMSCAVSEAILIEPPEHENMFSDDIKGYVASAMASEGFHRPPVTLAFAADDMPEVTLSGIEGDPELTELSIGVAEERAADVEHAVTEYLTIIAEQLAQLPLHNGSSNKLSQRIKEVIGGHANGSHAAV